LNAAVQRELTDQHEILDVAAGHGPRRGEDSKRNRQVERGSRLADVRGGEIDGDPMSGELEAGVADGASHPVAALAHGGIRQPDHVERGQPERHVHFNLDAAGFDSKHRRGPHAGKHAGRGANGRADENAGITGGGGVSVAETAAAKSGQLAVLATPRQRPRTRSLVPAEITLLRSRFQLLIFATLVSNSRAIEESVSPRFTR
jgi:hypothetical protein